MIKLHPIPDVDFLCPYCQIKLETKGWYIPGMRNLAHLQCVQCQREYYGDLPAGHGLYYPMLLEKTAGIVHNEQHIDWFAEWLHYSYTQRVKSQVEFTVESYKTLTKPILLNCLDAIYGHCLLKLLNAQYYIENNPRDSLIILIPRFLRWMVPDGVAAIWTVDLPLKRGREWNDWLAAEIKRLIEPLEECRLGVAFSHPHPEDFDIQRFSRVAPFPIEKLEVLSEKPAITFIWRDDRVWGEQKLSGRLRSLPGRLKRRFGLSPGSINEQKRRIVTVAEVLRKSFPHLDFAVAGLGKPGGIPRWITDLRTLEVNEKVERSWCERYAQSRVVIGLHGSNMLLPSAHAGSVIELVPFNRWGNLIQDILINKLDARENMFLIRFLPAEVLPAFVAEVTVSLLHQLPSSLINFKRPWCDHRALEKDPWLIINKRRELGRGLNNEIRYPQ